MNARSWRHLLVGERPVVGAGEAGAPRRRAPATTTGRPRRRRTKRSERASCMAPRRATLARNPSAPRVEHVPGRAFTCRRARPFSACGLRLWAADNAGLGMRSVVLATVLARRSAPEFRHACARKATPRAARSASDGDSEENDDTSAGVVLDNAAFEQRLAQSEALVRNNQPTVQVGGYVDFGFFVPQGNGVGLRRGLRARVLPAVRGPVRLGVPGRHPRAGRQHARRGRRSRSRARRDPLRQHQLARRARLHRSTRSTWCCARR